MNSLMNRTAVLGFLLGAFIVSVAMQPLPASAHNENAQGTVTMWGEGTRINQSLPVAKDRVYVWSTDFGSQLGNRSFVIFPDGSSNGGRTFEVTAFSANKGGQALSAKKDGGGTEAICTYLYSIITYPNGNSVIKAYAISLYRSYGCQPAL